LDAGPGSGRVAACLLSVATGPVGRVAVGTVLAIAGVVSLADRTGGLADVGSSAGAIAVAIAGLVVIGAPALGRLVGRLDEERLLRVREEERAALAAHLHDSVLQTLVVIQRSDDPRRMGGLARTQERELRTWLYEDKPLGEPTTLAAAVEAMADAIEVDHHVRIDVVAVGDAPLDEIGRAVVGATRRSTRSAEPSSGRFARRRPMRLDTPRSTTSTCSGGGRSRTGGVHP